MSSILDKLNNKQQEAASKIEGPVLILAGAGSGKTRTITYRIAHMIRECGISPYNILAVTFTKKAADEMRTRVSELIGEDGRNVFISTFHAFGARLLRVYGSQIGFNANFTIYNTDNQKKIIKDIIKNMPKVDKGTERMLLSAISKLKEENISPEEYASNINTFVDKEKLVAEVYPKYNKILKENNAMDFSDILYYTGKLLTNKEILTKVQEKFRYLMVDEYQDTNKIQYDIVSAIAAKYRNICVVGDENQSIYAFRGADIQNILSFTKDYRDAMVVKLEENYRSTGIILDAANSVIKNNKTSIEKKLWTRKDKGELITLYENETGRDEVNTVLKEISELKANGRKYKDITILYRTNAQSRLFEEGCLRENVPYKIFGGMQFYQRAEIMDILAYFSVVVNPLDTVNLSRIVNVPKRKLGDKTIDKVTEFATENGINMQEALRRCDEIPGLSPANRENITNFIKVIDDMREMSEYSLVSDIYNYLIESIDYKKYLEDAYDDYENRLENIDELYTSIAELENLTGNLTLREYLENVTLISATDELDEERDYVKLMTIHNAKGLEFPIVFVVGVEEEIFPGRKVMFEPAELEEERRLCYVAITRAEEKLYLSYAKSRYTYGELTPASRSQFIGEIPGELLNMPVSAEQVYVAPTRQEKPDYIFRKTITTEDLNRNMADCPFKIGDKVMHKKFGLGVVQTYNEKKITIKFVGGTKEIAMALADKFLKKEK